MIIDPATLYRRCMEHYFGIVDKMDSDILTWLDEGTGKRRENLSKWLDMALQTASRRAIEIAAAERKIEVDVEINIQDLAKQAHARLKADARAKTQIETMTYAMEYLVEEAGYDIVEHKVQFSFRLAGPAEETPEKEVEKELEEMDGLELPATPPAIPEKPTLQLAQGKTYSNQKGALREIMKLDNGTVEYKITKSANKRIPNGTTGTCPVAEFLEWAKEIVTAEVPAQIPVPTEPPAQA
jgi:hypothetical protein